MMEYTNNTEYRECLRLFFNMNSENYKNIDTEWDSETIDEMSYDETSVSTKLNEIYEKTKNNVFFKNIYEIAAAKMISTDYEIGLSVCISYDYFKSFYGCLTEFDKNPQNFNEKTNCYVDIMKKLK